MVAVAPSPCPEPGNKPFSPVSAEVAVQQLNQLRIWLDRAWLRLDRHVAGAGSRWGVGAPHAAGFFARRAAPSRAARPSATGPSSISSGPAFSELLEELASEVKRLLRTCRTPILKDPRCAAVASEAASILRAAETTLSGAQWLANRPELVQAGSRRLAGLVEDLKRRASALEIRVGLLTRAPAYLGRLAEIARAAKSDGLPSYNDTSSLAKEIADEVPSDINPAMLVGWHEGGHALLRQSLSVPGARLWFNSLTTALVAVWLARGSGRFCSREQLVATAAFLADIGMLWLPEEILRDRRTPSPDAEPLIRQHPGIGAYVVDNMVGAPLDLGQAVYQHHESLDGSGYPDGVAKPKIGELARLICVAGRFVALCGDWGAETGRTKAEAARILRAEAEKGKLEDRWVKPLADALQPASPPLPSPHTPKVPSRGVRQTA